MSQVLKQKLSVQVFQLFRTAGFTLNITQNEQLQGVSDKIADLVEDLAKERTVELIRAMQKAVGDGFTAIGKDVDAVEKRLDKLEGKSADKVQELQDELRVQGERYDGNEPT